LAEIVRITHAGSSYGRLGGV